MSKERYGILPLITSTALRKNSINSLEECANFTEGELLLKKRIGKKSIERIRIALNEIGLSFRERFYTEDDTPEIKTKKYSDRFTNNSEYNGDKGKIMTNIVLSKEILNEIDIFCNIIGKTRTEFFEELIHRRYETDLCDEARYALRNAYNIIHKKGRSKFI